MTNSLTHHRPRPLPSTRVGDAEREDACQRLAAHYSAGRLTPAEMDERTTAAVAAITHGELSQLLSDLPPLDSVTSPRAAPVHPSTPPAAMPAAGGRAAVLVLWGLLTAAAAFCTCLLLLVTLGTADATGFLVFLGIFGSAVASSGITYFVTRPRPPAPAPQHTPHQVAA